MRLLDEWANDFLKMGHLGDVLVEFSKITPVELAKALDIQEEQRRVQKLTGGKVSRLGEILLSETNLKEEDIIDIFEIKLGLTRIRDTSISNLEAMGLNRDILSQFIPLRELERLEFLPYRLEIVPNAKELSDWNVYCLIHDPLQGSAVRSTFHDILCRCGSKHFPSPFIYSEERLKNSPLANVSTLNIYVSLARRGDILRVIEDLKDNRVTASVSSEHGTSQLWQEILDFGISRGCSDIHVFPYGMNGGLHVSFRENGLLLDESKFIFGSEKFSQRQYDEFLNVLFDRAKGMDRIRMKMTAQDGAIQEVYKGKVFDIRLASIPIILDTYKSCKITLRIHSNDRKIENLEDIGFLPHQLETVRSLYLKHNGLLLMTGPTSSGKTTTLHAMLRKLNLKKQTCYTLEDPVEHRLPPGAFQTQISEKDGLTFPAALRSLLRHDPNIVLVGEMRDPETAHLSLDVANTGHSVFSTVHANSAYQVPQRLFNMGIEPYQLFSSLNGVISQRLAVRNCLSCLVDYVPTDYEARLLGLKSNVIYKVGSGKNSLTNDTCSVCDGRGYVGRVGIFEILPFCMYLDWEKHVETPEKLKLFFDGIKDEKGEIAFPELSVDAHRKMEMGWISPKSLSEAFSRLEA